MVMMTMMMKENQQNAQFDVCVTVHHWYNNINSQVDATITHFIHNYNQLNMFLAIISPILRSTRLCLQFVVQCTGDAAVRAWVDPRVVVQSEGLCQWKILMTPAGIEPATFRFSAQHLNHCATAASIYIYTNTHTHTHKHTHIHSNPVITNIGLHAPRL